MKTFDDFLKSQLQDPDFKKEYDALEPEFAIIQAMIETRRENGITQAELSQRTGITQANISRLENGTANPSLNTLKRLADGLGKRLYVDFLPA